MASSSVSSQQQLHEEPVLMATTYEDLRVRAVLSSEPDDAKSAPSGSISFKDSIKGFSTHKFKHGAKRSNSTSNDSVYERDRFRSRLTSFHLTNSDQQMELNPSKMMSANSIASSLNSLDHQPYRNFAHEMKNPLDLDSSYLNLNKFSNKLLNIKLLTNLQLSSIMNWYFTNPLPPVEVMFPWLHGIHESNKAQMSFMSADRSTPPKVRNLMLVRSNKIADEGQTYSESGILKNSVKPIDILEPLNISKVDLAEKVGVILRNLQLPSNLQQELIDDCIRLNCLPILKNLDPKKGVSLRNFHIQVVKVSHISDFIVYCFNEDHTSTDDCGDCRCLAVSRILKIAQLHFQYSINSADRIPFYSTYILGESDLDYWKGKNEIFMSCPPIDSNFLSKSSNRLFSDMEIANFRNWDVDYLGKEKIEISRMSSATKVGNVWLGNLQDFKNFKIFKDFSIDPKKYPHKHTDGICYVDPKNSIVSINEDLLDSYSSDMDKVLTFPPENDYKIHIQCCDESSFPTISEIRSIYDSFDKGAVDDIHLNFPPSGSIGLGDCSDDHLLSLIHVCKLLYFKSSKELPALIYCSDGYTETSLLSLAYLIYSQGIPFNQALVNMHVKYERPFYIFGTDCQLLRRLEPLLLKCSPALDASVKFEYSPISSSEFARVLLAPLKPISSDWVQMCEGSLPSRILSHLYLGNLVHANNLDLLRNLNIENIITVGEQLNWLTDRLSYEVVNGNEYKLIKFSDPEFPIKRVLMINNLQDDGIDELINSLTHSLDFIDDSYRKKERVLVHCRVGVSRSATVCIAEVMKRLNCSLSKAYLYVRVRRLNVIIQPNLRFMYELFKWQEIVNMGKRKARTTSYLTDATTLLSSSLDDDKALDSHLTGSHLEGDMSYSIESLNSDTSSISLENDIIDDYAMDYSKFRDNSWLRDIDWFVLCREIESLNFFYISR